MIYGLQMNVFLPELRQRLFLCGSGSSSNWRWKPGKFNLKLISLFRQSVNSDGVRLDGAG